MTSEERHFHCACIMGAARKLGMGLKETATSASYAFSWFDPAGGQVIAGPDSKDRAEALELACTKLADHLNAPPISSSTQAFHYTFNSKT
jgi:hypothetical protein